MTQYFRPGKFPRTQKEGLGKNIQSVHEGNTYSCNTCNFLATQKGNLGTYKMHVTS